MNKSDTSQGPTERVNPEAMLVTIFQSSSQPFELPWGAAIICSTGFSQFIYLFIFHILMFHLFNEISVDEGDNLSS